MIAHLHGVVAQIGADDLVVDVAGVGMHVLSTPGTTSSLMRGQEVTLQTSLVVREDSLTLFGFAEAGERDLFELVQVASGVGPKLARAMVSVLSPEQLTTAIAAEDTATLTTVPGIGRKGAERIIIELRDRIGRVTATSPAQMGHGHERDQVTEALVGLGWSAKDAEMAVDNVESELDAGKAPEVSVMLRRALQMLSKSR